MRAVLQRVTRARVLVEGKVTGEIGAGLLVLLGVGKGDTSEIAAQLAEKTAQLRIFNDAQGKMKLLAARYRRGGAGRFAIHALRRHQPRPPSRI